MVVHKFGRNEERTIGQKRRWAIPGSELSDVRQSPDELSKDLQSPELRKRRFHNGADHLHHQQSDRLAVRLIPRLRAVHCPV